MKMFQVVAMWNLSRPDKEMKDSVQSIKLRGYDSEVFLTGEFARRLRTEEIKSLSVSDIADRYCPTRRNLYFAKGVNRPPRSVVARGRKTWGGMAGHIVENYVRGILDQDTDQGSCYSSLIESGKSYNREFKHSKMSQLEKLKDIERISEGPDIGDIDWLLRLLDYNGRAELGSRLLHSMAMQEESLEIADVELDQKMLNIRPKPRQIGISSPATPDFIIPDFRIVGDVKSGKDFKEHFLLTCAGYALAYENEGGEDHNIDWGIIYFFPTRSTSEEFRPLTFAQVYIFPIDDNLRFRFRTARDEAYDMISRARPPDFPPEREREHCKYRRFMDYCKSQGLEL
jgi:CRISPR/Cas system-associated exonuclease Cas4 (RecB family)